ncbi:MAG: rod shape-determining protein MreC [Elusimicrobia bacterium]|nr:rod shape-determining protein MreC [Elusimicrobiota bacterium]
MYRETQVSNYVLAVLAALALVLLSLPLSAPVRAFKAAAVYLLHPAAFYGAKGEQRLAQVPPRLASLLRADLENVQLQAQLRETLWQKSELDGLRAENHRLAQALGLRTPSGHTPLWADVMERDPLHWYNSIMVTAGSDQGVTLNAPVFGDQDGTLVAIGRVAEVRPDASLVLLMTDELSSVAAYLSTSAVEGLIQGQGGPRLRMNYLPADVVLSTGDLVFTSPTSATFPGEILLGRVTAVNPHDPFLTFQSVEVRPAADAAALNHVMILLAAGPGRPAAAPAPPKAQKPPPSPEAR